MSEHEGGYSRPRIASWPHWYGPNPYLPMLYGALETLGVEHVSHVPLDPSLFEGPDRVADFLHLHWLYPLFRGGAGGQPRRWGRVRDGLARIRAIRSQGVPVIWTVHNVRPHDGFRLLERGGYASAHRTVDLRLFHSHSGRNQADAAFGAVGQEELVVYHGTFKDAFPSPRPAGLVRKEEGVPEGHRLLLCLGQIRDYKGFDIAVRAMRRLEQEPLHLLVVGRPIDSNVRRLLRIARGLVNVTVSPGEAPAQRVADVLHAADALLLPYRAITGSGVLLHALTVGKGVIASDLPYFREILGGEPEAGVLVRPGDVHGVAEGIRRFFSTDPGDRGAAAGRLGARFDWATTVDPLAKWVHDRYVRG